MDLPMTPVPIQPILGNITIYYKKMVYIPNLYHKILIYQSMHDHAFYPQKYSHRTRIRHLVPHTHSFSSSPTQHSPTTLSFHWEDQVTQRLHSCIEEARMELATLHVNHQESLKLSTTLQSRLNELQLRNAQKRQKSKYFQQESYMDHQRLPLTNTFKQQVHSYRQQSAHLNSISTQVLQQKQQCYQTTLQQVKTKRQQYEACKEALHQAGLKLTNLSECQPETTTNQSDIQKHKKKITILIDNSNQLIEKLQSQKQENASFHHNHELTYLAAVQECFAYQLLNQIKNQTTEQQGHSEINVMLKTITSEILGKQGMLRGRQSQLQRALISFTQQTQKQESLKNSLRKIK